MGKLFNIQSQIRQALFETARRVIMASFAGNRSGAGGDMSNTRVDKGPTGHGQISMGIGAPLDFSGTLHLC